MDGQVNEWGQLEREDTWEGWLILDEELDAWMANRDP